VKGVVHHRRGKPWQFVRFARRSIEIEPNSHVLSSLGAYLGDLGPIEAARLYADEGLALDPLSWISVWSRGYLDMLDGKFEEAFTRLRVGAENFAPGEGWSMFCVGYAAAHAGNTLEAREFFTRSVDAAVPLYSDLSSIFLARLQSEPTPLPGSFATGGEHLPAWRTGHTSMMAASGLAWCGESEAALMWLEHAVEQGFLNYRYLGDINPFFDGLRGLPSFTDLVATAKNKLDEFDV